MTTGTKCALFVDWIDASGQPAKVIQEIWPRNPNFHKGLDIRPVSDDAAVGWIVRPDGSVGPDDSRSRANKLH